MKRALGLLVILLILVSPMAHAKTETNKFSVGESFFFKDKNITVLNIDTKDDKVIVCVNNVKDIISDEGIVNEVNIDLRSTSGGKAELKMTYTCDDECLCDGLECSNIKCFPEKTVEEVAEDAIVAPTANTVKEVRVVNRESQNTVSTESSSNGAFLFTFLLLLLVIIGAVVALRKN